MHLSRKKGTPKANIPGQKYQAFDQAIAELRHGFPSRDQACDSWRCTIIITPEKLKCRGDIALPSIFLCKS
jgi:hypothetical protein